jgi:hypothetical protein
VGVVAGAQEQGEPGGQRVKSGINVRGPRVVAPSSTASNTGSALGQEISPGQSAAGEPAAARVPGAAPVASTCVRSAA